MGLPSENKLSATVLESHRNSGVLTQTGKAVELSENTRVVIGQTIP